VGKVLVDQEREEVGRVVVDQEREEVASALGL
jgi:hypothetical protein